MLSLKSATFLMTIIRLAVAEPTQDTPPSAGSGSGSNTQGSSASHTGQSSSQATISTSDLLDDQLANDLLVALAVFVGAIFIFRTALWLFQRVRLVTSLNNSSQRFFAVSNPTWASVKKNILYAPLFRTRHNEEIRLSSAINMGTLPSRSQTIFMAAIFATNILLCVYEIPWSSAEQSVLSVLRNRTGTLSTVNLIPMVMMAGRNNPMIGWLNVSYDTFNMMHRLFGRIVTIEAIAHTLCWMIAKVEESGWKTVQTEINKSSMIMTGFVATVFLVAITIQAYSPIRHAFYETFLHLHILFIIVSFIFLWLHLDGFYQQRYLLGTIICWKLERTARLINLIYRNISRSGMTKADIDLLPGDALRVTLQLPRPWTVQPGQHVYMTMPTIGLWTSHPFSIAWSDIIDPFETLSNSITTEKSPGLVLTRQDINRLSTSTVSMIIRRRTGFTDTLFNRTLTSRLTPGHLTARAFVEGPYGLTHPLTSYGTVLLFAAGVGITHQIPYIRSLLSAHASHTTATRRIVLIWTVQSPEHLEWVRPWMTSILAMPSRRDVLRTKLFITRPRDKTEVMSSPSETVQMFPGRPDVDLLVAEECGEAQVGAMAVSVCGTGSLADEVRRVCRERGRWSCIDFFEESFSW